MPMVSIKILDGHSPAAKRKMAKGIQKAILENTHLKLTPDDVWIVFQDVKEDDWLYGKLD